jgi:type II restriction enzyme
MYLWLGYTETIEIGLEAGESIQANSFRLKCSITVCNLLIGVIWMPKLEVRDLVKAIAELGTKRTYEYFSGRNTLRVIEIASPEGPISFVRGESETRASISINKLVTAASVFSSRPNYPIHFDRLYDAVGNDRSALETLLAHTPHFFICYPQRTNPYTGVTSRSPRKHLMWCPEKAHPLGEMEEADYDQVITDFELEVNFGDISITQEMLGQEFETIEAKRTHTQIQIALVEIGRALDCKTWIAANDRSIPVKNATLGSLLGVIQSLDEVDLLYNAALKRAASLIDCIWLSQQLDFISAVIEVEHSTGVMSGLERMLSLKNLIRNFSSNFIIVAPDDQRNKVIKEATKSHFRELNAKFLPYSNIRVLYGLIQHYSLSRVVNYSFINPFLESIVEE